MNFRRPSLPSLHCFCVLALVAAGSARAESKPVATSSPAAVARAAAAADSTPPLTFAEAQEKIAATRRYVAHPAPAEDGHPNAPLEDFRVSEAPPPPRAETVPPTPVAGYVWVPGHYMPVEGKWRWVRGEWAAPATPSSVWISARYDAKDKKWTPGYWQPDRPSVPEAATSKDGSPAEARY